MGFIWTALINQYVLFKRAKFESMRYFTTTKTPSNEKFSHNKQNKILQQKEKELTYKRNKLPNEKNVFYITKICIFIGIFSPCPTKITNRNTLAIIIDWLMAIFLIWVCFLWFNFRLKLFEFFENFFILSVGLKSVRTKWIRFSLLSIKLHVTSNFS